MLMALRADFRGARARTSIGFVGLGALVKLHSQKEAFGHQILFGSGHAAHDSASNKPGASVWSRRARPAAPAERSSLGRRLDEAGRAQGPGESIGRSIYAAGVRPPVPALSDAPPCRAATPRRVSQSAPTARAHAPAPCPSRKECVQ